MNASGGESEGMRLRDHADPTVRELDEQRISKLAVTRVREREGVQEGAERIEAGRCWDSGVVNKGGGGEKIPNCRQIQEARREQNFASSAPFDSDSRSPS